MITDIKTLRRALKPSSKAGQYVKPLFAGVILYEGASQIDGAPIVVIANKIMAASANEKTGAMVQTFIIRSDVDPVKALKLGLDSSVCGACMHRPANNGTCYVQVAKSVLSVFEAYKRGRYARPGIDFDARLLAELFRDLIFRLGTYGDPAAAPFMAWRAAMLHVAGHAGYSHQWRDKRFQAFKMLCMASADSAADMSDAHAMGWRTFRVRNAAELAVKGLEVVCPASKEAGYKTNCATCKACGGLEAKAKASIVIVAHGATAKRHNALLAV